jgi:hypothetical protein
MTVINTKQQLNRLLTSTITLLLIASMVSANLQFLHSEFGTAISISDSVAAASIGGDWGACGILAGFAIGVIAAGAASVSMGFGAVLVLSVGAHVAGYYCVFS